RPVAAAGETDLRHPAGPARQRHVDPDGRAERQARPRDLGLRRCTGARPHADAGRGGSGAGRSARRPAFSRRWNAMTPMKKEIERRDARLRRMKWLASGLLLLAGALYVAAQALEARYPWLRWMSIVAEASMVGAIADWFAVTALFHHP